MQPSAEISKGASLHALIAAGKNIAISHELFKRMRLTPSLYSTIRGYGYTLIIDEVVEIIEPVNLSKPDTEMLFQQGLISIDADGRVKWTDCNYRGRFEFIKRMADSKTLVWFNHQLFLWLFPFEILESFADIYVLTFLFKGSHLCNLFRLHGIEYRIYHVQDNELIEGQDELSAQKEKIKELLEIYDGTLNSIGDMNGSLSATWYKKEQNRNARKQVANNARNYLTHKQHAKAEDCIWSTFSAMRSKAPIKDYSSGFVSCNARATNEYGNRHNLAYLLNVYENPFIIQWFADNGIAVDEDSYALSQLLQWIWRSAIRNREKISLYLPSKRMRNLLIKW